MNTQSRKIGKTLWNSFLVLGLGWALSPQARAVEPIQWHLEGAEALGTGCNFSRGDTHIVVAGGEASVQFDRLGLWMDRPENADSMIVNCRIRIPVTLAAGYQVENLRQYVRYNYAKSLGSEANLTVETALFGQPGAKYDIRFPMSLQSGRAHKEDVQVKTFPPTLGQCRADPRAGLVAIDVGIAGIRQQSSQWVTVDLTGAIQKLVIQLFPARCAP